MLNKGILLAGKEKLYNVYRGTVSHVSLSYSPQTDIKAGTRVNITVNANSGYQNPSVSVIKNDGTGSVTVSGSGSSRYFTMPKSDVTINASASLIPTYSVSGSASGGGISFSKTSGIYEGETITVYLSPNAYYNLSSLTSSPSVSFSGSGNTRTFRMPASNVMVTATFVAMYDFMIYVERTTYDSKTYTGYNSFSYMHIGRTQGSFSGAYLWDNATYTIPGKAFYTLQDWAPNPWLYINMDVSTTTTMPSGVRIDIQRVDTGKTITLNASIGSHTFTTSKDEGAEGFYLTQADVGKWIPYKVTRGMYRI